jgi:lipid-A-disaccharide synthase
VKIFLIAGEESGDKLGAAVIDGLWDVLDSSPKFVGIGGIGMTSRGLQSIFPMSELSVMGFTQIASQYNKLRKRLDQTVSAILDEQPDILLTIDAPEFCFRVAKKVKSFNQNIPIAHYVAPSVWAWRPKRALKISNYIDHVLALFPFEAPYFKNVGLSCDFVGHPIVLEDVASKENIEELKKQYFLGDDPIILCLPGSRKSEINRLMPPFGQSLQMFSNVVPNSRFILCSTPNVFEHSKNYLKSMPQDTIFLSPEDIGVEKYLAFKKASFKISVLALAASGTVSLELAANRTPMVIGYDMNYLSRQIIQMMMRIDSVNLVNLITGNRNIPECIGANLNSENLFLEMVRVYSNNQNQIKDFITTMALLGENNDPPNVRAAKSIIQFYKNFKTA